MDNAFHAQMATELSKLDLNYAFHDKFINERNCMVVTTVISLYGCLHWIFFPALSNIFLQKYVKFM